MEDDGKDRPRYDGEEGGEKHRSFTGTEKVK